eukprot:CAMPEP_0197590976 /NCGR_PEP_ID=MMETSP1326-20131121/12406_1 /TAXON_ID=1155430 /ORGANISM="Genus nov. species nov., Strain RCC2288" /LENGTH=332 /DNA_ID=CAMNT_0043156297 /DNA_START=51 /DNA_END=1049 /DNA_ORIENTATION=+
MATLQINAFFKPKTAAPAKTGTVKKASPFAPKTKAAPAPAKKAGGFPNPFAPKEKTAAPAKKAAPPPAKKAAPFKKAAPIKKAAPSFKGKVGGKASGGGRAGADLSKWYGNDRKLYLPGGLLSLDTDVPSYLNGSLAGDYGFDPLKLGEDGKIEKYRIAEVIHARWAMLAIPGMLIPEALGIPGGVWTETGKVFLDGEAGRPELLQNPILFAGIQIVLLAAVEGYRSGAAAPPGGFVPFKGDFDSSAFDGLDPINPGGPLDFFGVASTPEDLALLKVKEIKNGRLAMVAMLGFFVQALVTSEGPAANWGKHVADPFGYNFVTLTAIERTPVL